MKSQLNISDQTPTYPAMYKSLTTSLVVLFTDKCTGTVLVPSAHWNIGEHSDDFVNCTMTNAWQRLPDGTKVILEN